ncbi:hypothetical protein [uncultured Apibacter sp.]|uniref:hypothetical protein n=1 Tax=uncultured Apibacter sp. TaxID=1778616 RepID=UPI0025DAE6C3|nr:hypothetical protein [uncultured Apibacter sp.]
MDRIYYYHFSDNFNARKYGIDRLLRFLVYLKKLCGIKRSYSSILPKLYGGSNWWSFTREVLQYVINISENDSFLKRIIIQ